MSKKGFPKKLYAFVDEESGGKRYFVATEDPRDCADQDGARVVAVYRLVGSAPMSMDLVFEEPAA